MATSGAGRTIQISIVLVREFLPNQPLTQMPQLFCLLSVNNVVFGFRNIPIFQVSARLVLNRRVQSSNQGG